jgi:hypothetical protein
MSQRAGHTRRKGSAGGGWVWLHDRTQHMHVSDACFACVEGVVVGRGTNSTECTDGPIVLQERVQQKQAVVWGP